MTEGSSVVRGGVISNIIDSLLVMRPVGEASSTLSETASCMRGGGNVSEVDRFICGGSMSLPCLCIIKESVARRRGGVNGSVRVCRESCGRNSLRSNLHIGHFGGRFILARQIKHIVCVHGKRVCILGVGAASRAAASAAVSGGAQSLIFFSRSHLF